MVSAEQREDLEAAQAFRPNSKPVVLALAANVLLAALFFGVPYYRGRLQAEASLGAFSRFASCLLDAQPATALALGMPRGEREHFAGLVMRGPADWPKRCMPALRAIAPPEATFLWPSVKTAGADVRALVALQERELHPLLGTRDRQARIPARPLLALARLRGGLALLARATGVDATLDQDVVRFHEPAALIEPARLPITAGTSAALSLTAGEDGLRALAFDARGISVLRVEDGKVDRRRVRRTSLVRGALSLRDQPLLVWAMPASRCEEAEDHCARRATGVAVLGPDALGLPEPVWLGAHPRGRIDRSAHVRAGDRLDVLALANAAQALEIRSFDLSDVAAGTPAPAAAAQAPEEPAPEGDGPTKVKVPPRAPRARTELPATAAPSDALLLERTHAVAFAQPSEGGFDAFLYAYGGADDTRPEAPRALGRVAGAGAWIEACEASAATVIAFGTAQQLAVARVQGGEVLPAASALSIELGEPLAPEDAGADRVHVLCEAEPVLILLSTARGELTSVRCEQGACVQAALLADRVASFAAVRAKDRTLVAYSRVLEPQLRMLRLDPRGAPAGEAITPAACWDPEGGMCGRPTLVADSGRVLLAAREGSDLLVLESDDGGVGWKPLSGLKVGSATSTDVSAPMDQHRKRKGLD